MRNLKFVIFFLLLILTFAACKHRGRRLSAELRKRIRNIQRGRATSKGIREIMQRLAQKRRDNISFLRRYQLNPSKKILKNACDRDCNCSSAGIVDCSVRFLSKVPAGIPHNASSIDVSHNKIKIIQSFQFAIFGEHLEFLYLQSNNIRKVRPYAFSRLKNLKFLDLRDNKLQFITNTTFRGLSKLNKLSLDYNKINFIYPYAFRGALKLQNVGLEGNHLTSLHPDVFVTLRLGSYFRYSPIKYLSLTHNKFEMLNEATFSCMSSLIRISTDGNPWDCSCKMSWLKNYKRQIYISECEKNNNFFLAMNQFTLRSAEQENSYECKRPTSDKLNRMALTSAVVYDHPFQPLSPLSDHEKGWIKYLQNDSSTSYASFHLQTQQDTLKFRCSAITWSKTSVDVATEATTVDSIIGNLLVDSICSVTSLNGLELTGSVLSDLLLPFIDTKIELDKQSDEEESTLGSHLLFNGSFGDDQNITKAIVSSKLSKGLKLNNLGIKIMRSAYALKSNEVRVQYSSHSLTHTKETQRSKTFWIDVIYPKSANESVVFARVGDVAVLRCRARGHTDIGISWILPNSSSLRHQESRGQHRALANDYLEIRDVNEEQSGVYTCVIRPKSCLKNEETCTTQIFATLRLFVIPVQDKRLSNHTDTIEEGEEWKINCSSKASPRPAVAWLLPSGHVLVGGKKLHYKGLETGVDGEIIIRKTNLSHIGVYRCFVVNQVGASTASVQLQVRRKALNSTTNASVWSTKPTLNDFTFRNESLLESINDDLKKESTVSMNEQLFDTGSTSSFTNTTSSINPSYKNYVEKMNLSMKSNNQNSEQKACYEEDLFKFISIKNLKNFDLLAPYLSTNSTTSLFTDRSVEKQDLQVAAGSSLDLTCPQPSQSYLDKKKWIFFPSLQREINSSQFENFFYFILKTNENLMIPRVTRSHAGVYACITNNVPRLWAVEVVDATNSNQLEVAVKVQYGDTLITKCQVFDGEIVSWSTDLELPNKFCTNGDGVMYLKNVVKLSPLHVTTSGSFQCMNVMRNNIIKELQVNVITQAPTICKNYKSDNKKMITAYIGQSLQLYCCVDSIPKASYSWKIPSSNDDSRIMKLRNGTLLIKDITFSDQGKYICSASNVAGKLKLVHSVIVELPLIDFGADLDEKNTNEDNVLSTASLSDKVNETVKTTDFTSTTQTYFKEVKFVSVAATSSKIKTNLLTDTSVATLNSSTSKFYSKIFPTTSKIPSAPLPLTFSPLSATTRPVVRTTISSTTPPTTTESTTSTTTTTSSTTPTTTESTASTTTSSTTPSTTKSTASATTSSTTPTTTKSTALTTTSSTTTTEIKLTAPVATSTKTAEETSSTSPTIHSIPASTPSTHADITTKQLSNEDKSLMLVPVTTPAPATQSYIQTELTISSQKDLEITNRIENDTFVSVTITNAITSRESLVSSSTLASQVKRIVSTVYAGKNVYFHCKCKFLAIGNSANRYEPRRNLKMSWTLPNGEKADINRRGLGGRAYTFYNGTLLVRRITTEDKGTYVCTSTDIHGRSIRTEVLVRVYSTIPMLRQSYSQTVRASLGRTIKTDCSATGHPSPKVSWRFPDGRTVSLGYYSRNLVVDRQGRLILKRLTPQNVGRYLCIAENSRGKVQRIVYIKPHQTKPRITRIPSKWNGVKTGQSIRFPCRAVGYPKPIVGWRTPGFGYVKQNKVIRDSYGTKMVLLNSGTLIINRASHKDRGYYYCIARNARGIKKVPIRLNVY